MAPSALPFPAPSTSQQYADDLAVYLGAPLPVAPSTERVLTAWVDVESPTFPGYNGLGTELYLPGATHDPSNPAVYDYSSLSSGLTAAVDMIKGLPPQTIALAPQLAADVAGGHASEDQLVSDIRASHWAGLSKPDTYDANAILARLGKSNLAATGAPQSSSPSSSPAPAVTTGFDWNPLSWPGQVVGSVTSSLASSVGVFILKGVLTLMGAGMVIYGTTLLTDKKAPSSQPGAPASSSSGPGASGEPLFGPEDMLGDAGEAAVAL